MEPWKKKTIIQNFANAIKTLEYTLNELDSVVAPIHLGAIQTVISEYNDHLIDLLEGDE